MKLEPRVLRPALSMLLSVLITASVGRALVPWSIVEVNGQEDSFEKLFSNIQAGCFDSVTVSDDLKNATLQRSFVGNKTDALMVTSNRQSVLNVCSEFGKYVKLSVELYNGMLMNNNNNRPPAPTLHYFVDRKQAFYY